MLFAKTVKKQGEKIIKLDKELQNSKQEIINFLNNTIRELLNLQDVNSLGLAEKEKDKHRNIIINALVESHLNKINELSSKLGSDR